MSKSSVDSFHQAAGRVPLLTGAEEVTLSKLVRAGLATDPAPTKGQLRAAKRAKDRMIRANLRLVISIAQAYRRRIAGCAGIEIEDLLQEGVVGLNRAVEKFDPEKGYKFSTYATWWIRQAMTRACETQSQVIRVSSTSSLMLRRWVYRQPADQSWEGFCAEHGYDPKRAKTTLLMTQRACVLSLDRPIAGLDGEQNLGDMVADEQNEPSADWLDLMAAVEALEEQFPGDLALVRESLITPSAELAEAYELSRPHMLRELRASRLRLITAAGPAALELVAA